MDARTWKGLVRALRRTVEREAGTAEELITLWQSSKGDPGTGEYKGIHRLVYKKQADIPALLSGEVVSDLNPKAAAFIPIRILKPQADDGPDRKEYDEDDVDEASELAAPPAEEDSGIDHALDLEAAARAADNDRVEQILEPPTEEELQAAALITKLYRRKLARKQTVSKKGREAERERFYQMYREHIVFKWTNWRYKALFLGFIPLVLLCLETYNTHVLSSKKKAMVRREIAPHHQYEAVMAQIDSAM